jgi:hypothetical protein
MISNRQDAKNAKEVRNLVPPYFLGVLGALAVQK